MRPPGEVGAVLGGVPQQGVKPRRQQRRVRVVQRVNIGAGRQCGPVVRSCVMLSTLFNWENNNSSRAMTLTSDSPPITTGTVLSCSARNAFSVM